MQRTRHKTARISWRQRFARRKSLNKQKEPIPYGIGSFAFYGVKSCGKTVKVGDFSLFLQRIRRACRRDQENPAQTGEPGAPTVIAGG